MAKIHQHTNMSRFKHNNLVFKFVKLFLTGRSSAPAKSSLFSLAKTPTLINLYSTRRPPQRKSTNPSPTRESRQRQEESMAQKLSQAPSISLRDIKSRNALQDKIVDYLDQKITIAELLREIGLIDQLFFPVQTVHGQETGAIMRTGYFNAFIVN